MSKLGKPLVLQDKVQREPVYCLDGIRHIGGVTLVRAFMWNVGTWSSGVKGELEIGMPHREESTEAERRSGAVRSSEEVSVMDMERRDCIVQVVSDWSTVKNRRN